MKIRVKEIGKRGNTICSELKDLSIYDKNGIEWTKDLITASDFWNAETEEYEMISDDYEWWKEYINNHNNDEKEITELGEKLGIEESEIYERINEHITNDLEHEHNIKQFVIAEIREENK